MAAKFPNSKFIGFDLSETAIQQARSKAKEQNITNVTFEVQDATQLPPDWTNRFEYVFVHDLIHDLPQPPLGVKALAAIVKPNGHLSIVDMIYHSKLEENIGLPQGNIRFTTSIFYCMGCSLYFGGEGAGVGYGHDRISQHVEEAGMQVKGVHPFPQAANLLHISALKPLNKPCSHYV